MARPKKEQAAQQLRHLGAWVTEEDFAAVDAKARRAGLSRSAFVRQACLDAPIVVRETRADFALTYEINMVGVNLRQALQEFRYDGRRDPENLLQAIDTAKRILAVAHEELLDGSARR
jgi:hypothetical protein